MQKILTFLLKIFNFHAVFGSTNLQIIQQPQSNAIQRLPTIRKTWHAAQVSLWSTFTIMLLKNSQSFFFVGKRCNQSQFQTHRNHSPLLILEFVWEAWGKSTLILFPYTSSPSILVLALKEMCSGVWSGLTVSLFLIG